MEQIILSKIEWLAEWFMQLFFDPVYYCNPEGVTVSLQNKVDKKLVKSPVIGLKKECSGKLFRMFNLEQSSSESIKQQVRVALSKLLFIFLTFVKRFTAKTQKETLKVKHSVVAKKSTLNRIQDAFNKLQVDLRFKRTNHIYHFNSCYGTFVSFITMFSARTVKRLLLIGCC